ncbi:SWF or SNF family helicase [Streptomyces calvus]|uniref:SWF or SNF family helicase n=1 Tax=Streptomyces calvus TaxID=67282 RepID=A0A514JYC2_9ACTN|nr:SWF or SNF family helicase [Streptomyces calvus]QDI72416.1 SWF or SNF family helicase [Streptomyces calvus]
MNRYHGDKADTERIFAALPPARGRGFAQTWWGRAWLTTLEGTALDSGQLKAGRGLARAGAVGAVSVRPGRITAVVKDRDGTAHRADVLVQELSGQQWDRFLAMAGERAGHVAALLDREMPTHLVEDAELAGVELLPGPGDLEPECDCGTWDHCAHTASLCYQVARLLDQDPFVLLLMRGRSEQALLDALHGRGDGSAGRPGARVPEGVDAAEAYAAGDILPSLPAAPALPTEPAIPPSLDTETAPPAGIDPSALEFLAARTAARAYDLLAQALRHEHERQPVDSAHPRTPVTAVHSLGPTAPLDPLRPAAPVDPFGPVDPVGPVGMTDLPAPEPSVAVDAVRLAAGAPGRAVADRLAEGSGRGREGLAAAVRAWEVGGAAALAVLDEEWTVRGADLARARAALESAWAEDERPALRARANRWTVVDAPFQLRLGRDGRWWPYRKERGRWLPAGGPAQDPATALATAERACEE